MKVYQIKRLVNILKTHNKDITVDEIIKELMIDVDADGMFYVNDEIKSRYVSLFKLILNDNFDDILCDMNEEIESILKRLLTLESLYALPDDESESECMWIFHNKQIIDSNLALLELNIE